MMLERFVLVAKRACYVGDGAFAASSRPGSHDLRYEDGSLSYLDCYFGGTNFCGQEIVWENNVPVWGQTYFGYILEPELIIAAQAGAVIKAALTDMYVNKQRFLGGTEYRHDFGVYVDESQGSFDAFSGQETICVDGRRAYELHYQGGLITP